MARTLRIAGFTGTIVDPVSELRAACTDAGSQAAWADRHDISPAYVSDVLNGRRAPGETILAALGLQRSVEYVKWTEA